MRVSDGGSRSSMSGDDENEANIFSETNRALT
jgi:hypothetical protein